MSNTDRLSLLRSLCRRFRRVLRLSSDVAEAAASAVAANAGSSPSGAMGAQHAQFFCGGKPLQLSRNYNYRDSTTTVSEKGFLSELSTEFGNESCDHATIIEQ